MNGALNQAPVVIRRKCHGGSTLVQAGNGQQAAPASASIDAARQRSPATRLALAEAAQKHKV